jgi:tetratricopeptide (TPR) repeat protein
MQASVEGLWDEAVGFLGDEKPLHAIQILRRIISIDPEYGDAYLKLAEVYISMRQYDAAERLLTEALSIIKNNHKLMEALGSLYYNLGEMAKAFPLFRKLSTWHPNGYIRDNPNIHLALATIFLEQEELAEATGEVKKVLRVDAKYPDANGILGRILLKQKDFPSAIKHLQRELALNETSMEFRLELATAFYLLGDLPKALDEFTLLIDTDPEFFPGWLMCGKILLELGKVDESEFYLQRAHSLNPKSAEVQQSLANLYSTIGEIEKARSLFDELARANAVVEDDTHTLEHTLPSRHFSRRNGFRTRITKKRRRR